jgi:hypothetical protein
MGVMERARGVGIWRGVGRLGGDPSWGTARGACPTMGLRVHPATRATVPDDLGPLLVKLQEAAERGEDIWSLTHLDHDGDGGVRCAIWWEDAEGETRQLDLSSDPEELLWQFRLYCEGLQP